MKLTVIGIVILGLCGSTVEADPIHKTQKNSNKSEKREIKSFSFEADDIEGELPVSEGTNLFAAGSTNQTNLITIRQHFILEIIESSYDVY